MCATWNFSAAPEPTTASLTARAAYSNTGTPAGMAHSAAPRACPSLSALSGLRLTNTRSTATSAGACSHTSALRPSKIRRSRRADVEAAVRHDRQLLAAAFDHAEPGAPRAGVEAENADRERHG